MTNTKKKILIVDDEKVTTELAKVLLERHGFEVICTYDGLEALERINEGIPDLILLDIMLPGLDGFEVCRRLKSEEKFANTPIIMFTAKSMPKDIEKGMEVGADEYLIKPYAGKDLLGVIKKHLLIT